MKCYRCDSTHTGSWSHVIRELAKGSPTRGKNMKFVETKVTEVFCRDCHSKSFTYEELGGKK